MSNIVNVSTASELLTALQAAQGGEKILLASGDYGGLNMYAKLGIDGSFASNVTIASADPNNPATFTSMHLKEVGNITIEDVVFDYTMAQDDSYNTRPFQVNGSENITIRNSVFDGDTTPYKGGDDEYGTGYALFVRGGSDIEVENNEFKDWNRAVIVDRVDDVTVRGNDIHDIRTDGMNFVQVTNVLIEDNYIHDFTAIYESSDHRDMIQFWTNGANTPSTDIVIRNNTLDMGEGSYTQSIFMRNEAVDSQGGGQAMYYQNVLIEGNTIYNGHLHGITVGETDGLTIRENSLIAVADTDNPDQSSSALWVPVINVNKVSQNVTIESNAMATINGHNDQSDWLVDNNTVIQNTNPFAPGHYADIFVTSSSDVGPDGHAFVVRPDSILDQSGAGAQSTDIAYSSENVLFDVTDNGQNVHTFDAQLTLDGLADRGIENAEYTWHFGDGKTAEGVLVEHEFTYAGTHDVTLVVKTPTQTYTADSPVDIRGGQVVSFNNETGGGFVAHASGEERALGVLKAVEDQAIQLGDSGTVATVSRGALGSLQGSDTLNLDFTLSGEGGGEVFRVHSSFVSWVSSSGGVAVQLHNESGGRVIVNSGDVSVADGASHDVSVRLKDETLELMVDGVIVDSTGFKGGLPTAAPRDLSFGNPWGKANFDGEITDFSISVGDVLNALPDGIPAPQIDPVQHVSAPDITPDPVVIDEPEASIVPSVNEVVAEDKSLPESVLGEAWSMDRDVPLTLKGDYVNFGRLTEYEDSQAIGFSVDFNADVGNGGESRLIWNHMKLGLTVLNDEIMVQAATADNGFRAFTTEGLGLTKGEDHTATVLLDSANDRLQVLVNDEVVIDIEDVDFDHIDAGGREWGWSVGTAWGRDFNGEVSAFEISDQFAFSEDWVAPTQGDIEV